MNLSMGLKFRLQLHESYNPQHKKVDKYGRVFLFPEHKSRKIKYKQPYCHLNDQNTEVNNFIVPY